MCDGRSLCLCPPLQFQTGQGQVPTEPVVGLLTGTHKPAGTHTHTYKLKEQMNIFQHECLTLDYCKEGWVLGACHSPCSPALHLHTQKQVSVEEEVAKVTPSLTHIHHEAVTDHLASLHTHTPCSSSFNSSVTAAYEKGCCRFRSSYTTDFQVLTVGDSDSVCITYLGACACLLSRMCRRCACLYGRARACMYSTRVCQQIRPHPSTLVCV